MIIVVSPHLDDAVLSCGRLLALQPGACVVTVFAGRPERYGDSTWDRRCGFAPGDDVIGARRAEDAAALARLHAIPRWLDFVDDQYGEQTPIALIAAAVRAEVERIGASRTVYIPLGLFHRDHERTHLACRGLIGTARRSVVAYEDAPYRNIDGLVSARVDALEQAGLHAHPVHPRVDGTSTLKRQAVACYRSQLRGLASSGQAIDEALDAEQYWSVDS